MYEFEIIRIVNKKIKLAKLILEINSKVDEKFKDLILIESATVERKAERKVDKLIITFCKRNFAFYFHEIGSLVNIVDNVIYNYQEKSFKLKI